MRDSRELERSVWVYEISGVSEREETAQGFIGAAGEVYPYIARTPALRLLFPVVPFSNLPPKAPSELIL